MSNVDEDEGGGLLTNSVFSIAYIATAQVFILSKFSIQYYIAIVILSIEV